MRKNYFIIIIISTIFSLSSCSTVKVSNSTEAEAVPVKLIGNQVNTNPLPSQKKIIQYRIIQGGGIAEIESIVNKEILNGWQPFGGVAKVDGNNYMQAIVKYDN